MSTKEVGTPDNKNLYVLSLQTAEPRLAYPKYFCSGLARVLHIVLRVSTNHKSLQEIKNLF